MICSDDMDLWPISCGAWKMLASGDMLCVETERRARLPRETGPTVHVTKRGVHYVDVREFVQSSTIREQVARAAEVPTEWEIWLKWAK